MTNNKQIIKIDDIPYDLDSLPEDTKKRGQLPTPLEQVKAQGDTTKLG